MIEWEFPEKLGFLFQPARYKVAFGGRDAAKSWSFARALLLLGAERPLRIGCFREVQKSIKDSVHKLLSDQIEALGLGSFYQILQAEIRAGNGTEVSFSGLSNQTRDSIKSFEGLDVAWVEEAQSVVKRSWDILIPTIRKPDSELWVSFNPSLDTDDTYQRFVVHPPPGAQVVKINWEDNPWRSKVLDAERERMQRESPDDYAHIYGGNCRPAVEGAIYYNEVSRVRSDGRLGNVPYDPLLRVHPVFDLGWNDYMSILLVQRKASEIRVIRYIEDNHRTLADYDADLRALGYNYGTFYLPHDGQARDYKSGKSAQEILQQLGRKVEIVENIGLEDGIRAARLVFPRVYFDQSNASELLTRLGRYRRRVSQETGTATTPVHDDDSHGCLTADALVSTSRGLVPIPQVIVGDEVWTPRGYARVLNSGVVAKVDELVEITTIDGNSLSCTSGHKILTQRGFVMADRLRYLDRIYSGKEWQCILSSWCSMVANTGFRATITGEMNGLSQGHQISTGLFGNRSMARFLMGMKSTISTAIHSIMMLPILSVSMGASIREGIQLSDTRSDYCGLHQRKLYRERQSGTRQRKAINGIPSTARVHGRNENGVRSFVRTAASLLARLILRVPSGAIRIAKLRHYVSDEGGTSVHDLTVENHGCYMANGLLVSNSDGFRYMSICCDQMINEPTSVQNFNRAFAIRTV